MASRRKQSTKTQLLQELSPMRPTSMMMEPMSASIVDSYFNNVTPRDTSEATEALLLLGSPGSHQTPQGKNL